jgi:hypothetical protein
MSSAAVQMANRPRDKGANIVTKRDKEKGNGVRKSKVVSSQLVFMRYHG